MDVLKLMVALALITNPNAAPDFDNLAQDLSPVVWDGKYGSANAGDASPLGPYPWLDDVFPAAVAQVEPISGAVRVHAFLAPMLQELAIKLEVMDQREADFLLHEPQSFPQDLKQLQRRYLDLFGAPVAADCNRLPDRDVAGELLTANRAYKEELSGRLAYDPVHAGEIEQAIAETDFLHQVWNTIREARCGFYNVAVRRQALKQLRELIGEPAFYRGDWPPPLPTWRLPRSN